MNEKPVKIPGMGNNLDFFPDFSVVDEIRLNYRSDRNKRPVYEKLSKKHITDYLSEDEGATLSCPECGSLLAMIITAEENSFNECVLYCGIHGENGRCKYGYDVKKEKELIVNKEVIKHP